MLLLTGGKENCKIVKIAFLICQGEEAHIDQMDPLDELADQVQCGAVVSIKTKYS